MTEVNRYPLSWPFGWKRTPSMKRKRTRFTGTSYGTYSSGGSYRRQRELTTYEAIKRLDLELDRLRAREVILSTNVELTSRGEPRSGRRAPDDPGVAVYFRLNNKDRVLACDTWDSVAGNIAGIAAHIDCIRGIDRYGVGTLDQAFAGYDALPPPSADNRAPWRGMLQFKPDASVTRNDVDVHYRMLAKQAGTDEGALLQLNLAREAAYKEISA